MFSDKALKDGATIVARFCTMPVLNETYLACADFQNIAIIEKVICDWDKPRVT